LILEPLSLKTSCSKISATVAQLDRVSPSEGEGRRFNSCRLHQFYSEAEFHIGGDMKQILKISCILFLTGCSTSQVTLKNSKEVPAERILAFQKAEPSNSEIVVIRDHGMAASGCYYGVMIDQVLAARLDVAERATFKLEPGERVLKIVRDPQGKGLCGLGDDQIEKKLKLQPWETQKFRLSLDLSGQPYINPYMEE
jgi:hypothetical protein